MEIRPVPNTGEAHPRQTAQTRQLQHVKNARNDIAVDGLAKPVSNTLPYHRHPRPCRRSGPTPACRSGHRPDTLRTRECPLP